MNLPRVVFPVERRSVWNGVEVPPEVAPKYRLIDNYCSLARTDYIKSEDGEVRSHKDYTHSGDTVVVVGGRRGITSVHAAWESEPDGEVIIFEPSVKNAQIIQEVIKLNNVENECEIRKKVVGTAISVNEFTDKFQNIHPKELPECDVLEMDCEGGELEIVKGMEISPRVIIMEVHPKLNPNAPEAIDELINKGYDIVKRRTNEGESLTSAQFEKILEDTSVPSPVVVAVKSTANN